MHISVTSDAFIHASWSGFQYVSIVKLEMFANWHAVGMIG